MEWPKDKVKREELALPVKIKDEKSVFRAAYAAALPPGARIHLSGACGTGMASVLSLLKQLGFNVSGSDKAFYPPMGEVVRKTADRVYEGYSAENLRDAPDLVVIGNSLSRGNPEVEHVLEQGIPFASMPEVFEALLIGERTFCPVSLVVAGTHGKTTTTAAAAFLLERAGRKPGFFVGGMPREFETSVRPVSRDVALEKRVVVLEGDEYDSAFFAKYPKFHSYRPDCLILTSVEFDHADIYNNVEEIETEFTRLAASMPEKSLVLVCSESEGAAKLAESWRRSGVYKGELLFYGRGAEAAFKLLGRYPGPEGQRLHLRLDEVELQAQTPLSGEHNALNLLAAAGACKRLGVTAEALISGITGFTGVRRRQQIIASCGGITAIEDFAHHPTAVAVTLAGLREAYAGRRIIAVFEPRSNTSRRAFFQEEYPGSFESADIVVLREVADAGGYQGTGQEIVALDVRRIMEELKERGKEARAFAGIDEILDFLLAKKAPGDVIVLMSNGDFGGLPLRLAEELKKS